MWIVIVPAGVTHLSLLIVTEFVLQQKVKESLNDRN